MAVWIFLQAAKKGASETVVGLIFGVFSLVQLLFSLLLGKYMVKIGVKFTFLSGLLASGTCTILFGLLDEAPSGRIFIALCFLLHGVDAVGCAASMTASFTILMSMFPHNISTTIGFLELLAGLGLVMGPPLGGFLYEAWGYRMTLIIVGVFMLLTIPVILAALPPQVLVGSSGSFIRLLSLPSVIVVALLICCVDSSMGFFDPNISLFLFEQFNLSSGKIGLVFMSLCISYSVSCPVVGYVSDRRPQWMRCMMLAGAFVSGICFCLLGPVPILHIHTQLWLVVVVLAVLGVSIATAIVPTFSEILLMATNNGFEVGLGTLGLVSGICNGLMSFGGPLASLGAKGSASGATTKCKEIPKGKSTLPCRTSLKKSLEIRLMVRIKGIAQTRHELAEYRQYKYDCLLSSYTSNYHGWRHTARKWFTIHTYIVVVIHESSVTWSICVKVFHEIKISDARCAVTAAFRVDLRSFIGPTLGGLLDDYVNFKWAATMEGLLLILAVRGPLVAPGGL
ncbi:MFS-type transporter SLC18B1-like [Callorhinchus milii]|uniref:MFS-type transporter SLC18B1-like n=1 Tax=Callorhinchus milii TaxID=7868 RepID=UPI001C3FBAF0|nr:MFS-type transporter SLC18B1-like [Callorhinchus milii]